MDIARRARRESATSARINAAFTSGKKPAANLQNDLNPTEEIGVGDLVEIPGGEKRRVTEVFSAPGHVNGLKGISGLPKSTSHNCARLRVAGIPYDIKAASVTIIEKAKK